MRAPNTDKSSSGETACRWRGGVSVGVNVARPSVGNLRAPGSSVVCVVRVLQRSPTIGRKSSEMSRRYKLEQEHLQRSPTIGRESSPSSPTAHEHTKKRAVARTPFTTRKAVAVRGIGRGLGAWGSRTLRQKKPQAKVPLFAHQHRALHRRVKFQHRMGIQPAGLAQPKFARRGQGHGAVL